MSSEKTDGSSETADERSASVLRGKRTPLAIGGVVALAVIVGGVVLLSGPPGPSARSGPVPEFGEIEDVREMKAAFVEFLAPMIAEKNGWVLEQRAFLVGLRDDLAAGGEPSGAERSRVMELAERYRVPVDDGIDVAIVNTLLRHCDVVPPSLALAQAASESGWGRSRFAREGNNYFGEWCFSEGCGMVPGSRGPNQTHEVETFSHVEDAVDSYFRNLNRVEVYAPLRTIRANARAADGTITGTALAAGLERYSERGEVYIEEVRELIRYNELARFDETMPMEEAAAPPSG